MAFEKHARFLDDNPNRITDQSGARAKGAASRGFNAREMAARIKQLGERARSEHVDPTVRVRIDPSVIRPDLKPRKGKARRA